jgi:hypothetical protein
VQESSHALEQHDDFVEQTLAAQAPSLAESFEPTVKTSCEPVLAVAACSASATHVLLQLELQQDGRLLHTVWTMGLHVFASFEPVCVIGCAHVSLSPSSTAATHWLSHFTLQQ